MKKISLILSFFTMLFVMVTFAMVVVIAVKSCNRDDYCEGEIIKKEFLDERYEQIPLITTIYNGTTVVPVTTLCTYYYPKRWRLTIELTKDENTQEKQIYVTEECYNAVSVGDWFVYDEAFCSFKEPCEKSVEREE